MEELFAIVQVCGFTGLMIVAVGVVIFVGKRQAAQVQQQTADYKAGPLAARLGMRLERGDPNTNLFVTGKSRYEAQRFDVFLRGERNGVPTEIVFYKETQVTPGFTETRYEFRWDVRITALTSAQFGHFEVTLRQPQSYQAVRPFFEQAMPEVRTGDGRTDSMLRVTSDNPAIAAPLGPLLAPLTRLQYVHVIGKPGAISFLMSHGGMGPGQETFGVGYALHDAELVLDVLTRIALTAEGRG